MGKCTGELKSWHGVSSVTTLGFIFDSWSFIVQQKPDRMEPGHICVMTLSKLCNFCE